MPAWREVLLTPFPSIQHHAVPNSMSFQTATLGHHNLLVVTSQDLTGSLQQRASLPPFSQHLDSLSKCLTANGDTVTTARQNSSH